MKLAVRAKALGKKLTLMTTAFVLAVSSLTALTPFVLAKDANAIGSVAVTSLSGWYLGESKVNGHQAMTADGLHVWTTGGTSDGTNRKAAGYLSVTSFPLSQAADADIVFAPGATGPLPSLQIGVDMDNNPATWDGYLVYEPSVYGAGNFWTNKDFGIAGGQGYTNFGTIADFANANPDAKVISIGYSLGTLGNHIDGDSTITKMTLNGTNYIFGLPPNEAPSVSFVTPTPGDGATVRGTINLKATITDDNGIAASYLRVWKDAYEVAGGGTLLANCQNVPGGNLLGTEYTATCVFDTTTVADGTKLFVSAQTQDSNGVNAAASVREITVDNTNPVVSKIIVNGTTVSGQYKRDSNCQPINALIPMKGNVNLTAVASDVQSDVVSVSYTVRKLLDNGCSDSAAYRSGNIALQQSNKNANNWNQPASTVFDSAAEGLNGKYTIVLVVKDDAGNQTVKYVDLNIDNTAPKIFVKQAGTAFPSPASAGSTTDKVFSKVSFKLSDNNAVDYAVINGHHMELSNGPWSDANFDAIKSYLTEDSNNTITVYDVFGNSTSYSFTYDRTVPVLTVDAPADLVTYGNSLTVTGSVFDDNLKEYKYQILDENKQNTLGSIGWSRLGGTTNTTGDLFTADISNLADGTYYISVWATDKAGNATNTSGNRLEAPYIMKFTVDRVVNVSIDTIASNTATPTIQGQMTRKADGSSVANTDVVVTVDGTSYTTTTDVDGKWSVQPTVGAGAHTVTVALAGGASLASTSFTTVFAPVDVDEEEEEETANPAGANPLQTPAAATPLIVNPAGQAALGANDNADDNGTPAVEGTSTEKNLAAAVNNTDGSAFGLAWYWWLLIVAGLATILWWIIAAARRRQEEN